ncbi:type II toxin-antitoxin system RelE/ParE family toxin [Pseudoduganella ginsengisoli]|uniref:Type II toxin-antitoxin system RelE/ParE family toxin n=1 Tax=Pseudoduganella ginsengisoli TaxID=1462440 RepID=A0A6L6Q3U2_9BURK|nr:type II toxin-antitoxin system RelE/ParE family toxin [Pseudoduganella ginsengisoli]MTW03981.1 type II toxin-antitoxin system RelE/ParE family toxin [Pseudoduganella ginsengisoli]
MKVTVQLLESAESDLKDLRSYLIKNFGKENWQASYSKIKESVGIIRAYPEGGKVPDELANLNLIQYRQVISGMNRIIYEIRGDVAYLHIICDSRKDLRNLLLKRILRTA